MVKNQIDISKEIQRIRPELTAFGLHKVGLFGSFVRDQQNEASDIDFWVEFRDGKKTFRNFMALSYFLEERFERKIELVTPESLSSTMKVEILKEMRYVLEIQ